MNFPPNNGCCLQVTSEWKKSETHLVMKRAGQNWGAAVTCSPRTTRTERRIIKGGRDNFWLNIFVKFGWHEHGKIQDVVLDAPSEFLDITEGLPKFLESEGSLSK